MATCQGSKSYPVVDFSRRLHALLWSFYSVVFFFIQNNKFASTKCFIKRKIKQCRLGITWVPMSPVHDESTVPQSQVLVTRGACSTTSGHCNRIAPAWWKCVISSFLQFQRAIVWKLRHSHIHAIQEKKGLPSLYLPQTTRGLNDAPFSFLWSYTVTLIISASNYAIGSRKRPSSFACPYLRVCEVSYTYGHLNGWNQRKTVPSKTPSNRE